MHRGYEQVRGLAKNWPGLKNVGDHQVDLTI